MLYTVLTRYHSTTSCMIDWLYSIFRWWGTKFSIRRLAVRRLPMSHIFRLPTMKQVQGAAREVPA